MDKAFDWKEGDDMSLNLEAEDLRAKWEEHFAKLPEINWYAYGACSRCGASVVAPMRERHAMWHKNVTFQMWLTGEWARDMVNPFIGNTTAIFESLKEMLEEWKEVEGD